MSETNSEWIEVVVPCAVTLCEAIASELVNGVSVASSGVQVRKGEVVFWVSPSELEPTLAEVRQCLAALLQTGWKVDPSKVRAGADAPEEEWRDAWKKYFHVTRLTRQIVVVPSWEDYTPTPPDLVIHLDPGQAFGTGAHASTQLVLETLQDLVDDKYPVPETIFDLGTGSGILAIAAIRFWPSAQVIATDIDPLSIRATIDNATNNKVDTQVAVSTTDLSDVEGQFPLVLANIQAHILRDLRDELIPRIAPGGRLIVSGILSTQIEELCRFYCEYPGIAKISMSESTLNPDWSSAQFELGTHA